MFAFDVAISVREDVQRRPVPLEIGFTATTTHQLIAVCDGVATCFLWKRELIHGLPFESFCILHALMMRIKPRRKYWRVEGLSNRDRRCSARFCPKLLRLTAWGMNAILCDFECSGIAFIPTTSALRDGKSRSVAIHSRYFLTSSLRRNLSETTRQISIHLRIRDGGASR